MNNIFPVSENFVNRNLCIINTETVEQGLYRSRKNCTFVQL